MFRLSSCGGNRSMKTVDTRFRLLAVAVLLCALLGGGARVGRAGSSARATGPSIGRATIVARQRFFGLDNVDPDSGAVRKDRVIISWFGMASFAAAMDGHVVLLDAWVNRLAGSMRYVGTTPEEVAALRPE